MLTITVPADYVPDMALPRHPPYLAFVEANGLSGDDVVVGPLLVDEDARTLTATVFARDEHGSRVYVSDAAGRTQLALKMRRTVPLLSHPAEHGISADEAA